MTPEDIAKIVSNNPTLLTILGVLLIAGYVLKIVAQASETGAKLLGPLGKRWREQGNRAARRASTRRGEDNAVIADLRAQLDHFVTRVETLEKKSTQKDEYLTYDAEWHATNEIHAAEHGYDFPLPRHLTFNEFRERADGWSR
ncbi:hypothetical protein [Rhodococcoides fascians]|uniref:hypothetical protein n=1 Tax=Rhodococcoides fascians TaxID=1828 RepID=UPI00050C0870|nr:hypothetical protein [Rhodococcus fascians]